MLRGTVASFSGRGRKQRGTAPQGVRTVSGDLRSWCERKAIQGGDFYERRYQSPRFLARQLDDAGICRTRQHDGLLFGEQRGELVVSGRSRRFRRHRRQPCLHRAGHAWSRVASGVHRIQPAGHRRIREVEDADHHAGHGSIPSYHRLRKAGRSENRAAHAVDGEGGRDAAARVVQRRWIHIVRPGGALGAASAVRGGGVRCRVGAVSHGHDVELPRAAAGREGCDQVFEGALRHVQVQSGMRGRRRKLGWWILRGDGGSHGQRGDHSLAEQERRYRRRSA
jgi:hypothetical protein